MRLFKITYFFAFFCIALICCTSTAMAQSEKYELMKIEISGNKSFSTAQLKELIVSQETPMWVWRFLHSFSSLGKAPIYFDSTNIENDMRCLREFYTANGFFKITINPSYKMDSTSYEANLQYEINEGEPSLYKTVQLVGLDSIDVEKKNDLLKLSNIDTTKRFSQSMVKSNTDNIVTTLENNGYMLAKYDSTVVMQDTAVNKADVTVFFSAGKKYIVSDVSILKKGEGAAEVQDKLFEDIIGIKKGDVYSLEKIRMSQIRLYRTSLFNSVIVAPQIEDTTNSSVPIILTGNIGLLNEAAPEIIMNNQSNTFNVGLAASYARKNFFGEARKMSMTGSFGLSDAFRSKVRNLSKTFALNDTTVMGYFEGDLKIEQPYIFNRPIYGIVEGYYKINKDTKSNKRTYGGKLSLEFELPSYTFLNFLTTYYSFEVVDEIFNTSGSEINKNIPISIFGTECKAYRANDPLFPTAGYNLSFLIEEANFMSYLFGKIFSSPFSGAMFYKTQITAARYWSLSRRNLEVAAVKFKAGYMQTYYGNEIDIPSTHKFTVGGSNSLRGWKARDLAPTEMAAEGSISGGTFLLESSAEYRYKFTPEFGSVLFSDFGNAWLGYKAFRWDMVGIDAGIGFRYYSAFAPFRIDFGMKLYDPLNKKNMTSKPFFKDVFEFQFGIGEAF
jgi:outer membrane protein insertion porin family